MIFYEVSFYIYKISTSHFSLTGYEKIHSVMVKTKEEAEFLVKAFNGSLTKAEYKEYRIPKNIKTQDLVRGIINASFWHWHTIDEIQHTEAIKYLNNLEAIDNANPNEALKTLDKIKDRYDMLEIKYVLGNKEEKPIPLLNFNIIKQALIKAQEHKKALEILKSKDVLYTQIPYCNNVDEYNHLIDFTDFDRLTQEEFDLLKRFLND